MPKCPTCGQFTGQDTRASLSIASFFPSLSISTLPEAANFATLRFLCLTSSNPDTLLHHWESQLSWSMRENETSCSIPSAPPDWFDGWTRPPGLFAIFCTTYVIWSGILHICSSPFFVPIWVRRTRHEHENSPGIQTDWLSHKVSNSPLLFLLQILSQLIPRK